MRAVAAALALSGAAACSGCASAATFTLRSAGAENPPHAAPLSGPAVRALHLGDFGDPGRQQEALARAVVAAHRRSPLDLAFFAGDNLYECGPDPDEPGAEDCRFGDDGNTVSRPPAASRSRTFARHEAALARLAEPPAPEVYLALGNHDVATGGRCGGGRDRAYRARLKACLEVAHRSPLWRMPGRHYVVERGPARFIVLDTNVVPGDYGGFTLDAEVSFLAEEARACRSDRCEAEPEGCAKPWCFVVGHHPPAAGGIHEGDMDRNYLARMQRLLDAGDGRIRAWLVGHDHDLQHLRMASGLDVLVSGNGSRGRPQERFERVSPPEAELVFASVRWGYAILEATAEGWRYAFHGDDGAPLHCCATRGPGRCAPVACP